MKQKNNPFSTLTLTERTIFAISFIGVLLSFFASRFFFGQGDLMSTLASLIGVTALIFVAKGYPLGQALTILFALVYGAVSLTKHYYGEMITYLGMSAPMALFALISWVKHPYKDSNEVKIAHLSTKHMTLLSLLTALVTLVFYFILKALGTESLGVSTLSVTTSFFASSLVFLRSPYYALAYAANDLVLILLWGIASLSDPSYLPMLTCFVLFLLNDLYGFLNWKRMQARQND